MTINLSAYRNIQTNLFVKLDIPGYQILTFSDFEDQIFAEMLTFSTFFNTTNDIARIVSLLASLKGDILNMFYELDKNSYDLTTFKSMFTNTGSEFEVLNQLGKEIIKYVLVGITIRDLPGMGVSHSWSIAAHDRAGSLPDEQIAKQFKLSYNDYKKMIDNFDRIETDDDGKKSKINRESIFTVRVKSILFQKSPAYAGLFYCLTVNDNCKH